MRKQIILALFAAMWLCATVAQADSFTINGEFAGQEGCLPVGWSQRLFWAQENGQMVRCETVIKDGSSCLMISSEKDCDVIVWQDVPVEPGQLYRISAAVNAECANGAGAAISLCDTDAFSNTVLNTGDHWEELVLFAKAEPGQYRTRIGLRLGAHSAASSGTAFFDRFRIEPVSEVPENTVIHSLASDAADSNQPMLQADNMLVSALSNQNMAGWKADMGTGAIAMDNEGSIIVSADEPTAMALTQRLQVQGNTCFHFQALLTGEWSGPIRIGILEAESENSFLTLLDNGGDQMVDYYLMTAADMYHFTVQVQAGTAEAPFQGNALLDQIQLTRYDGWIYDKMNVHLSPSWKEKQGFLYGLLGSHADDIVAGIFLSWAVGMISLLLVFRRKKLLLGTPAFLAVLVAAFSLRIALCLLTAGHWLDIVFFSEWSVHAAEVGLDKFYSTVSWCDYPPLYIWLLAVMGWIMHCFSLTYVQTWTLLLIKLWPVLFDMALLVILRKRLQKKGHSDLLLMVMAFNPMLLMDGSVWGQCDSILAVLVLLTALNAEEKQYVKALVFYILAVMMKPQALLFGPIGLVWVVKDCTISFRQGSRKEIRLTFVGLFAAVIFFYAVGFVSSYAERTGTASDLFLPVTWMINKLLGTMTERKLMTNNCANFYALLNMNQKEMGDYPMLSTAAWVIFGLSYVWTMVQCLRSHDKHTVLLVGGVQGFFITIFMTQMEGRYAVPPVVLLLVYAFLSDDWVFGITAVLESIGIAFSIYSALHHPDICYMSKGLLHVCCTINMLSALFAVGRRDVLIQRSRKTEGQIISK